MALSRPIRTGPEASAAASLRQLKDLGDELWELIFLRVASPRDLVRAAAAACASFRRLITDPSYSFLRRYRSFNPPILVGVINNVGLLPDGVVRFKYQPVEPPHPNAPAAAALAAAAGGFSFDHLPRGRGNWSTCDVRDGRVLLFLDRFPGDNGGENWYPDLTVYDPLRRRYLQLPRIPQELLSFVGSANKWLSPSLVPPAQEEDASSFRVTSMRYCVEKLVVFIFSSSSGTWVIGGSSTWDALNVSKVPIPSPDGRILPAVTSQCNYYAYGCLYWQVLGENILLKFNISSLEFSTVDFPEVHKMRRPVVAEAAEGRIGMLSLESTGRSLYYNTRQNGGLGSNEWKTEDMIPLPNGYRCFFIVGALGGYIILLGHPQTKTTTTHPDYFSLEVKTLEIEIIGRMRMSNLGHVYPYIAGFPPSV